MNIKEIIEEKREMLQAAIDRGGNQYTFDYIVEQVISGKMHLWVCEDAIGITQFIHFENTKYLHGLFAAGNLQSIVEILTPQAENFGRRNHCDVFSLTGRSGWAKVFAPHGWIEKFRILEKKL